MTSQVKVRISRNFGVAAERVFDAWLDPAWIGRWMFGPSLRDETIIHIAVDACVGGAFSFKVNRAGQEIDHIGVYREIERPRRLVFTWGIAGMSDGESIVTIDIAPRDNGCELTLAHEMQPRWAEFAPRVEQGWTTMLNALGKIVE